MKKEPKWFYFQVGNRRKLWRPIVPFGGLRSSASPSQLPETLFRRKRGW